MFIRFETIDLMGGTFFKLDNSGINVVRVGDVLVVWAVTLVDTVDVSFPVVDGPVVFGAATVLEVIVIDVEVVIFVVTSGFKVVVFGVDKFAVDVIIVGIIFVVDFVIVDVAAVGVTVGALVEAVVVILELNFVFSNDTASKTFEIICLAKDLVTAAGLAVVVTKSLQLFAKADSTFVLVFVYNFWVDKTQSSKAVWLLKISFI